MVIEAILAAFPTGCRDGDGARIPCPVHHGTHNNVHVWPDGTSKCPDRYGVHCHSGPSCSQTDLVKAIETRAGVDLGRGKGKGRRNGEEHVEAVYSTLDGRRTVTYRKEWPKDWSGKPCNFRLPKGELCTGAEPHKHMWQTKGTPTKGLLLLLWEPLEPVDPDVVVIVEGEKCARAIREAGYIAASYMGGWGKARYADYSPVKGRVVLVWPDADTVGRTAADWDAQLSIKAGAESAQVVPQDKALETGEDAADCSTEQIEDKIAVALAEAPYERPHDAALGLEAAKPQYLEPRTIRNTAKGLAAILDHLRLEVRQNARNLRAEVRREDWPGRDAKAWTEQWPGVVTPSGWIHLSDPIDAAMNDVSMETFSFVDSSRNKLKAAEWTRVRFDQAMINNFRDHQADPFQDWLEDLKPWDREPRAERLWIDTLLMPNCELNRQAGIRFLVGAVRRAYEPGCVHDWMPLLAGPQGLGKSSLLQDLVSPCVEWYTESTMLSGTPKERMETTGPAVINEFSEMAGLDRAESAHFKKWIVTRADNLRPAYGRSSVRNKRRWVGAGTANEDIGGILPADTTGARRYVVMVSRFDDVVNDVAKLEETATKARAWVRGCLEQLWAEALYTYRDALAKGSPPGLRCRPGPRGAFLSAWRHRDRPWQAIACSACCGVGVTGVRG